jgi:hypothetical protein
LQRVENLQNLLKKINENYWQTANSMI